MAIENKKSLVQFGYSVGNAASTSAGFITFDSSKQAIYVGDGEAAKLVTSSVKDATYVDNILTITKIDGTSHTLNFKDVASASGTMAAFNELKTTIKNINDSIDALDSSYKAADKAINDKIGGEFTSTNTVAKAIEDAKNAAIAAGTVITESDDFITLESSVGENGATTYTIGTTNVAKATDLSDVSTLLASVKVTAEAARTEDEVNAQINAKIDTLAGSETGSDDSGFVTVTVNTSKGQVSGVNVVGKDIASAATLSDVKGRLDTFLNGADLNSTVDTLKEIQEWINGDGVNATELTEAIANEADLRAKADASLSSRIKAVEDDYLKSADKTELTNAINGVSVVANAAAVKTTTDASLALKADASSVYAKSETYTKTEVDGLVAGANTNASNAESNAKAYANAIKVNGQAQSNQNITLSGVNILVGGTGNNKDASISYAIEDLYDKVGEAANAGVQSLSVDANSSNYASVDKSTGTVSLTIKKVALKDATESKTGVADAYEVKTSILEAISTIQGTEGDASTAATVAGAKAYADEKIAENALKWNIL
jgi:hypothetical protein